MTSEHAIDCGTMSAVKDMVVVSSKLKESMTTWPNLKEVFAVGHPGLTVIYNVFYKTWVKQDRT